MNRFMVGLAVLAGCVVFGAGAVLAEEKTSQEAFPLPDIQADVPRFVGIIEAFGESQLDTALGLIEAELPGPFAEDVRADGDKRSASFRNSTPGSTAWISWAPVHLLRGADIGVHWPRPRRPDSVPLPRVPLSGQMEDQQSVLPRQLGPDRS